MCTVVLVHGSTQNPRGWDLLVAELERRGRRALTVDLAVILTNIAAADA